jgi:hypothetical protein
MSERDHTDEQSAYEDGADVEDESTDEGTTDLDQAEWADPEARGAAEPEGATVDIKEVDEADVEPDEEGLLPAQLD